MHKLYKSRIIFLYLYLMSVLSLAGLCFFNWTKLWTLIAFGVMIVSQAVFLLPGIKPELHKPTKKRSIAIPVIVASLMMAVLVTALYLALIEFFEMVYENWLKYGTLIIFGINWIGWGVIMFFHTRKSDAYQCLKKLTKFLIAGSFIELFAAVPAHFIVIRRPTACFNFFQGIYTLTGIIGGLYVMLWAFGPGVFFLFMDKKHQLDIRKIGKY